jgi:hypothetical protein
MDISDAIQNQPGTVPPPALVEELAEALAQHPPPPPSTAYETPIDPPTSTDQGPLWAGRVYAEYRRPDGLMTWIPITNEATYLAKGFVATGRTADWDVWSVEAARQHKWHGVGRAQS